jgi:hypothetical protein
MNTKTLEALECKAIDSIEENGYFLIHVYATDKSVAFTYSIGMSLHNLTDTIIFGLDLDAGRKMLQHVCEMQLRDNMRLLLNNPHEKIAMDYPVVFKEIGLTRANDYFKMVKNLDLPLVRPAQLVWPDLNGKFPWESGSGMREFQPLIFDL